MYIVPPNRTKLNTRKQCDRYDVYLANGLFSEAERAFNVRLTNQLRASGLSVFVPQETAENTSKQVSPAAIFSGDYLAIQKSDVMLAVLDGDVVDTGVSCEIGLARAAGIPIVGLWTDIRQERTAAGRPLLNIFLQGAIQQNGVLCATVDDAIQECHRIARLMHSEQRGAAVVEHYARSRDALNSALTWIPAAYRPPLDLGREIIQEIAATHPDISSLLDIGAGNGWLGDVVRKRWPGISYRAFDPADGDSAELPPETKADAAVLSFVLHDVADQHEILKRISSLLADTGSLIVLDLTPEDLPRLQSLLSRRLTLTENYETRITPGRLASLTEGAGLKISSTRILVREFEFSTRGHFDDYITAFGLDKGLDLPWLPLANHRSTLRQIADEMSFPFFDQRVFIVCRLTKHSMSPS